MDIVNINVKANHKLSITPSYAYFVKSVTYGWLQLLASLTVQKNLLISLSATRVAASNLALESRAIVYFYQLGELTLGSEQCSAVKDFLVLR